MNLADQCTSLPLSKRLAELNVPNESLFGWFKYTDRSSRLEYCQPVIDQFSGEDDDGNTYNTSALYIPAFTASELGELLPTHTLLPERFKDGWWCRDPKISCDDSNACCGHSTLVEAMGKMLEYLLEHSLIKL